MGATDPYASPICFSAVNEGPQPLSLCGVLRSTPYVCTYSGLLTGQPWDRNPSSQCSGGSGGYHSIRLVFFKQACPPISLLARPRCHGDSLTSGTTPSELSWHYQLENVENEEKRRDHMSSGKTICVSSLFRINAKHTHVHVLRRGMELERRTDPKTWPWKSIPLISSEDRSPEPSSLMDSSSHSL